MLVFEKKSRNRIFPEEFFVARLIVPGCRVYYRLDANKTVAIFGGFIIGGNREGENEGWRWGREAEAPGRGGRLRNGAITIVRNIWRGS